MFAQDRNIELASQHLARLGFDILATRHRTRHGALDVVAFDAGADVIVFAQVNRRRMTSCRPTMPARVNVRRMAASWLAETYGPCPRDLRLRFDAIDVDADEGGRLVALDHLEAAY